MLYDAICIGGGPAGLSAAIYLARFRRSVLVIDPETAGRWDCEEINQNYFGFPGGIRTQELRKRGKQQAKLYGAAFLKATVQHLHKTGSNFTIVTKNEALQTRSVILACGVTDHFLTFRGSRQCIGNSLFWCIVCDGFKTVGARVTIVGYSMDAGITALQFLNFTPFVTLVTNTGMGTHSITPSVINELSQRGITLYEGKIQTIIAHNGFINSITTHAGEVIETDYVFDIHESSPNTEWLASTGIAFDDHGYIQTDMEQRTSEKGIFAAGDVTKPFAHQIGTAVHEGATAGVTANYYLYEPYQTYDPYQ